MIAKASQTASYSSGSTLAATSNAKPRRASTIFDSGDDGGYGVGSGGNRRSSSGGYGQASDEEGDEEAFQRFRQEQGE